MAKYFADEHHAIFADLDRYMSDRFECYVAFRGTKYGFDVSFHVLHAQSGVASYVQYYHYKDGEYVVAKKTFEELKVISDGLVKEVEDNRIPFSNIGPMSRNALREVDVIHKESSGVQSFNQNLLLEQAPDWRTTLYGNRYPGHTLDNQTGIIINSTREVKKIKEEGSGRNKTYKTVSDESYIINHAKN